MNNSTNLLCCQYREPPLFPYLFFQFLNSSLKSCRRQRKHRNLLADQTDRVCTVGICPVIFPHRVQPDRRRKTPVHLLQPVNARPLVAVEIVEPAAAVQKFRRRHRRIPNQNYLVFRFQVVKDPLGRDLIPPGAGRRRKQLIVETVVEIINLQILKMGRLIDRLEQPVAQIRICPHRPAAVHQKQKLRLLPDLQE